MSSVSERPQQDVESVDDGSADVPRRLREARERSGLSLRQLAQRLDISASALSQIETGKSRPSVRTLYAVVSELNLSLDELFDNQENAKPAVVRPAGAFVPAEHLDASARISHPAEASGESPLQKADSRARLELDSGVFWDRLTSKHDPYVDFLHVTYTPGSASNANGTLVRHTGREYGIVLSGAIDVTVGFETYRCETGDSISFSSDEPHLLANNGDVPATAIWFVVGRRASDPRQPMFDEGAGSS
jgi:transcriptional regulator with XRE-family HTH domain